MASARQKYKTEWQRNWYQSLTESERAEYLARQAAQRKEPSTEQRERRREYKRKLYRHLYSENPGKILAKNALRRAARNRALPTWADKKALRAFYEACPAQHHVDHIYPLRSEWVCGLHTVENLQYLTPRENLAKGNLRGIGL